MTATVANTVLTRKERFRRVLAGRGGSISQWARDNGVSRTHLYAVLDGEREPSVELAEKIKLVLRKAAA